jgi:GMP synthase-like glutamine amidotransferase
LKDGIKRVHLLQHVPFEGFGSISAWLTRQGARVTSTRFFEEAVFPELSAIDLLIIMGGPMSVNDEAEYPWLRPEKEFIGNVVRSGMPVLGVCLGAQLIASALGAPVYKNPQKEIGWFTVEPVRAGKGSFAFPDTFTAFHWHGETFDLPKGAVRLARSGVCENQAFQAGEKAIGLQFHLESTPDTVDALVKHCREELVAGPSIQDEATLRSAGASTYAEINRMMDEVLAYLVG